MEATKLVSPKRERPCSSLSSNANEANGTPLDHKRPRPTRTSGRLMRDLVKDLRSHRVFSPSSELYCEMLDRKFALDFGSPESDAASKSARDRGLGKCSEAKAVSNSDAKIKPFIQPCFQRRLFKNPGSVSYRKLLPYLMDIAKQEPWELGINRNHEVPMDLEGEKPEALVSSQSDEILSTKLECPNTHFDVSGKIAFDSATDSSKLDNPKSISSDKVYFSPSISKVKDGEIMTVGLSPVSGNSHMGEDAEPCRDTEVTNSVTMHPTEDESQNENKPRDNGEVIVNQVHNDNVELCRDSEVTSVTMHPIEDEKQSGKEFGENDKVIVNQVDDDNIELCRGLEVTMHPVEDENQNGNKSRDDGEVVVNQVDDLDKEPNQMTPPDVEIFRSVGVEGNESDRPDHVQNRGHLWGIHSDKVHRKISSLANTTEHEFNSKISGVFKPRSKVKLFRSPGSFSYKRMLPFIMDIAKENSDASANGQIKKQTSLNKPYNSGFKKKHADESAVLPILTLMPISDSFNEIEDLRSDTESQMRLSSDKEDILQVKEVVSIEEQAVSRTASGSECVRSGDRDKLQYTQSLHSYLVSSRDCPNKGILRRNPRGCRGLCTCLNCASFRLNADRAFEFSRNQMEHTEELVLDLVDELACLRGMLEESTDNRVKEACRKSSEVEDLAKNRLCDMKYNLGIHCRITCVERPGVKFNGRVKEITVEMEKAEPSENEALI